MKNKMNKKVAAAAAEAIKPIQCADHKCEKNIPPSHNPSDPATRTDNIIRPSTMATDKLINNIVAESNAIMKNGHLRPKSIGSLPTASQVATDNVLHQQHQFHHAVASVNVARTQRTPAMLNEPLIARQLIASATIQQTHTSTKDTTHSNANDNHHNENNGGGSTSASKALPEQWHDVRTASSHPGLFIVIGVTIGMVISLGLIHLYRCRKPWHRRGRGSTYAGDDDAEQYTPAHRDLLPMEILNSSSIQYTDVPIDLW